MWTGNYDRKFKDEKKPKKMLPLDISGELTINLIDGTKIEVPEKIIDSPVVVSLGDGKISIYNRNGLMFVRAEGPVCEYVDPEKSDTIVREGIIPG